MKLFFGFNVVAACLHAGKAAVRDSYEVRCRQR